MRVASPRVVSLLASGTEILCALGAEAHLVARSHECDFPPSIRNLPVLTRPIIDTTLSSSAINDAVVQRATNAVSLYSLDNELLRKLKPDVVITQMQCEVCAVSERDVVAALRQNGIDARIVSLLPNSLDDIWRDIRSVAAAMNYAEQGERVVRGLVDRLKAISSRVDSKTTKPRVACIEWLDPLMSAGNWIPELVELAGGKNLLGESGKHSPWLSWEELHAADPDVLIVFPCGFDLERTLLEYRALRINPLWQSLRAVKNGSVFLCDGNQYFNRSGPRVVDSVAILAEILHPEQAGTYEGSAWRRADR